MDALKHLDGISLREDQFLASLNLESLYTSIIHKIGLKAVHDTLEQRGQQYKKHNAFMIRGTAMGSTCAPTYANIYLGWWEHNFVFNEALVEFTENIALWLRYIDNVVSIWSGTPEKFHRFVDELNSNSINLRVTAEINRDIINFLDIRIYRDINNNNVQTTVFRKDTATNNLLHANSQHPSSLIQGIPTGQYLRVKRLCSTQTDFKKEADKLYVRFKQTGYSHNSLKKAYKRALMADRNLLLVPKKSVATSKPTNTNKVIRFIGDYCSEHKEIRQTLSKHWQILEQDKDLNSAKPTWLENKTKGCHKCGGCLACPFIEKASTCLGRTDKPTYTLKHFMNCKTTGVIYLMNCKCGKRYVGKTKREFRRRILEHVGDVKYRRNTSVARHINEVHNSNIEMLKFVAVDHIKPTMRVGDIDRKLLQREAQWIYW
ncbi:hypothetical protein XELAEV_18037316mg [Xenopus laevis]|uniref:GIY-YIG domain-containing protein n=1 Tax=Xenopus laevis TaxID=8355 RepID=A0A974HA28_XENLA|nr:hypothetical protein XELAEV_18037316mg [Xenopus laevis]